MENKLSISKTNSRLYKKGGCFYKQNLLEVEYCSDILRKGFFVGFVGDHQVLNAHAHGRGKDDFVVILTAGFFADNDISDFCGNVAELKAVIGSAGGFAVMLCVIVDSFDETLFEVADVFVELFYKGTAVSFRYIKDSGAFCKFDVCKERSFAACSYACMFRQSDADCAAGWKYLRYYCLRNFYSAESPAEGRCGLGHVLVAGYRKLYHSVFIGTGCCSHADYVGSCRCAWHFQTDSSSRL